MLRLSGMLNKLMQFKCLILTGVWGQSPQSLGNFGHFLKKIILYRH